MEKSIFFTLGTASELYKVIERYDDGRLHRVWNDLELGLKTTVNDEELAQLNSIINQAEKDGKDVFHIRRMANNFN